MTQHVAMLKVTRARSRTLKRWAILAPLAAMLVAGSQFGIASAAGPTTAAPTPPQYQWPEFDHSPDLNGTSLDPSISTASASTLGLSWMTYTGSPVLSSPSVAWDNNLSETLVYVGNEAGNFSALNQATGTPVWSINLGSSVRTSPLVDSGSVWVAPISGHRMYKLNADTGAVECSAPLPLNTDASPTVATPPGGTRTIYMATNDTGSSNGPLIAINEATCAVDFSVIPEPKAGVGGIWDGISYAVDAKGEGLVLFGTADPDSAVYALDAVTGALVWRYATKNPPPGFYDVGAGVPTSAPGVNGLADGAAYAVNKYGYLAALDLTTGAVLWTALHGGTLVTPSLVGSHLIYTGGGALMSLNAQTGAVEWTTSVGPPVDSGAAIVGPVGSRVVAYGDLSGVFHVNSAETGAPLYSYQTGGYIAASTAEVDGNLLTASADGYVYDFTPGGGTAAAPSTAVTGPADGSSVPNPNGSLTISGNAGSTGGPPVASVNVDIQRGGAGGTWWDGATGQWVSAAYPNAATVASPGSPTSTWTYGMPVPTSGDSYEVVASAVNTGGVADVSATQSAPSSARSSFTVQPSATAPTLSLTTAFSPPAGTVGLSGKGFQPFESVDLTLAGKSLATLTADSLGAVHSSAVRVPPEAAFGPTDIVATGLTSGRSSSAGLYVTNAWSQAGGGPTRPSSEPSDNVFANHVSLGSGSYLDEAWSYTTTAPLATAPAVVDAVAYTADTAGVVEAVNVRTGMNIWSAAVAGGSRIESSPAVDAGSVIVGTDAGSVVALNAASGAVEWTASLGTSPMTSSPAVAGGVVYIGSAAGTMYALDESSGAVVWQVAVSAGIHSSPAVDTAAHVVVIGQDNGTVTALSTTTGATDWTFATGGAVTGAPVLAHGNAYFGSASGHVYAVSESAGTSVWTDTTGGPVTAAAALQASQLFVGDSNGDVYSIAAGNGRSSLTKTYGAAIVGVASTTRFMVIVESDGTVHGSKGVGEGQWQTTLGSAPASAPVILNGGVYVAGSDGRLHLWTIPGNPPA